MARPPQLTRMLVLAGALALAAPSLARADHGEPYSDPTVAAYLEVAEAHWARPAPSCSGPGGQAIAVHAVLHDNPDPRVAATAEQPGCRIWLDRDWWPGQPNPTACTIIAHEWGHLLGLGHSGERGDLMYREPWTGAPGCSLFTPRIALGRAVTHSSRPAGRRGRRGMRARRARRAVRRRALPEHRTLHRHGLL